VALHRAGERAPERTLLLLAVLALVGVAVALPGHPLAPSGGPVPSCPVLVVRAGVRGPPRPPRSTVR